MKVSEPSRGDLWDLDFDPTIGHEQAGARPALILSVDLFNDGRQNWWLPSRLHEPSWQIRWHVRVSPPEGGLTAVSFIQCENVRSVSKARLKRRRGRISDTILDQVEDRVRILLGL